MKQLLFTAIMALVFNSRGAQKDNLANLKSRNSALHEVDKDVSAKPIFKGTDGTIAALKIKKNRDLKKHITKVEALLVCVSGEFVFENEKGYKQILTTGDCI